MSDDKVDRVEMLRNIFANHPKLEGKDGRASRVVRLQGTHFIELWEDEHAALEQEVFRRLPLIAAGLDEMDPVLHFALLFLMKSW